MHLILYDGVCGLCGRAIEAVRQLDRAELFQYEPLQSATAERELGRHGINPDGLETAFVVAHQGTPKESVIDRSSAVLFVAVRLGWPWNAAAVLWCVPRPLRAWCYDRVARNRHLLGGGTDQCALPGPTAGGGFQDTAATTSPGPGTENPVS